MEYPKTMERVIEMKAEDEYWGCELFLRNLPTPFALPFFIQLLKCQTGDSRPEWNASRECRRPVFDISIQIIYSKL